MTPNDTVRVRGLTEFRRELRRIERTGGPDGRDMLKDANNKVANFVVSRSRDKASTIGAMQSKAASTMRAGHAQSRATVTGGAGVPYFFGAEFGATHNVLRRTRRQAGWAGPGRWRGYNQFLPWRGNSGRVGYFLFPTLREQAPAIVDMYGDELDRIAATAFPD